MERKKIIILRSNPVAPDSRVEKTAFALSESGHTVTVLCWDRTSSRPETEEHGFGRIERIRLNAGFNVGITQAHKVLGFWFKLFLELMRREYDTVHACDFDTALPGFFAALLRRKRRVYDIFDFYSEGGKVPGWMRGSIRFFERIVMRMAKSIVVVDENRLHFVPSSQRHKVSVIYNSPPDVLHEIGKPPVPKVASKFRIVYAGQLNEGRFILEMASAVNFLSNAEFIIAGFGSNEWIERLQSHIEPFKNVQWLGRLSFDQALDLEASSDLMFALYDTRIPQNRLASSNKLFEAMMLAKPILVNTGTSMDTVVKRHECGYVLEVLSEEKLLKLLESVVRNPDEAARFGKNGRTAYTRNFAWELMKKRLNAIHTD